MPQRTALVFVNAASRNGATDLTSAIEALEVGGMRILDPRPADIGELGRVLERRGELDVVIIAGGDGTLNGAAETLIRSTLTLGILPLGTANDLARTLGIPPDLAGAVRVITENRIHRIDVGRVNGKHFFNVASLGLSVRMAQQLDVETKRRWGVFGYALNLWRTFQAHRAFRAEVCCDGRTMRLRAIQISAGNGRHYGGGMTIAADAAIDDGVLDLVSLAPQGFWSLIINLPTLRWGWHGNGRRVWHWRCRELEIRTARPIPINTDGEVTTHTPAKIEVIPRAIPVLVPRTFLSA